MNNEVKYLSELIYNSFNDFKQSLLIENCNLCADINLTFLENCVLYFYNLMH